MGPFGMNRLRKPLIKLNTLVKVSISRNKNIVPGKREEKNRKHSKRLSPERRKDLINDEDEVKRSTR